MRCQVWCVSPPPPLSHLRSTYWACSQLSATFLSLAVKRCASAAFWGHTNVCTMTASISLCVLLVSNTLRGLSKDS